MSTKKPNLVGRKFHRLTVNREGGRKWGKVLWECTCQCGSNVSVNTSALVSGNTKSCGCWKNEVTAKRSRTHGMRNHELYTMWCGMLRRCEDPSFKKYERYGGRGIKVCEQWKDFAMFVADVGPRPSDSHSLDRFPNKDGNYEPGNVRWVTQKIQMRNTCKNRLLTHNGKTQCLADWAIELKMSYGVLHARFRRGEPVDRILHKGRLCRGHS